MLLKCKWNDFFIAEFETQGELIDFYDEGDHVRPFCQTAKCVDQIFQRPQICCLHFQKPLLKFISKTNVHSMIFFHF